MLIEVLVAFVSLIAATWVFLRLRQAKTLSAISSIPTVPYTNWPFLGSGAALIFGRPWEELSGWIDRFGGSRHLLRFELLSQQFLVLGDLKILQHVLGTNARNFVKDSKTFAPFMDLLGQGLVTSEGDKWNKQRKLLAPAFRGFRLQHVADTAFEATKRMLTQIDGRIGAGDVVEWNKEFRCLTLQVIAQSIMSLSPQESDEILPRLYLPIVDEANKRTWNPLRFLLPNSEYGRAVRDLNVFVSRIIEDRWNERATRARMAASGGLQLDILDRLLFDMFHSNEVEEEPEQMTSSGSSSSSASSSSSSAAEAVDEDAKGFDANETDTTPQKCPEWATTQLRDEIKTFLLAGHETSSLMLTWALYEVTQHPEVEERLFQEACEIFPAASFESVPDYKSLHALNYTENVLKEALRKYSVVPVVTREALETETVDGVTIPRGCTIVIPIRYIHFRPDLWEEPDKFNPSRWDAKVNAWQFLGFLQGPRFCIGQHFALIEAKIVLAMIIRYFKVSPCSQTDSLPHRFVIPVPPNTGMNLFVKRRV